jgi:hypothetical protein
VERETLERLIVEALGDGEHWLQVDPREPPWLVIVRAFGQDDDGEPFLEVEVIDPATENNTTLEDVWAYLEWCRRWREYGWRRKAKKTPLSSLRPSTKDKAMAATANIVPGKPKTDAELLASLAVKRAAIRDHVRLVAQHRLTGVLIHGRPGTLKTWDVEETLEKVIPGNWLRPPSHVTPGGLPELMEDYISGVLFLDDQLKLLKSDVGQQVRADPLELPGPAAGRA